MESNQERQQEEITALKAIYSEDFIEPPPPTAWKAATRLPEFIIKVTHPTSPTKVYFHLDVKLPRTYPGVAAPTLSIQKPTNGLSPDQIHKLTHAIIHQELPKHRGQEAILDIVTFAQEWLEAHATPRPEVVGSLAMQMNQRALDEEKVGSVPLLLDGHSGHFVSQALKLVVIPSSWTSLVSLPPFFLILLVPPSYRLCRSFPSARSLTPRALLLFLFVSAPLFCFLISTYFYSPDAHHKHLLTMIRVAHAFQERQRILSEQELEDRKRAEALADALNKQIRADADRYQRAKEEQLQSLARRKRANSEATEIAGDDDGRGWGTGGDVEETHIYVENRSFSRRRMVSTCDARVLVSHGYFLEQKCDGF
ncbi:hypothetical protein ONZ45_g13600 [Pleurotus djamor]|nr:hypothetical protein ONZ45_g13600 [Pleurotus djamor]